MSNPVAVFDIDGCIADYLGQLTQVRKEEGRPALPTPRQYDMGDWPEEDRRHATLCFADPDFYRRCWPIRGAIPALHTLKHFYQIVVVTARGTQPNLPTSLVGDIQMTTIAWLEAWQIPFSTLHFISGSRRATFLQEEYDNIAFVVDDNPYAITAFATLGYQVYAPAYPYNGGEQYPNLLYVSGIENVVDDRTVMDELPLYEVS